VSAAPYYQDRRLLKVGLDITTSVIKNPESGVVWHYDGHDKNGDGKRQFEEDMHRSLGSPSIKNGLLFITDFSGLIHCLDAKSGQQHWTLDTFAATWTTPLIVEDHVYIANEEGGVIILSLSADSTKSVKIIQNQNPVSESSEPLRLVEIGQCVYTTPIVANGVLYIAAKDRLFAIANEPHE